MSKTYAAFYLPQEVPDPEQPDEKESQSLFKTLAGAWKNYSSSDNKIDEDDLKDMARNMNIQGGTFFAQKYAAGALSKIINGEPVTNQTMLDSLFNMYAPALNAGLAQTGFNSIVEMKNAVQTGNNINVPNFIQGFSNGLSAIQEISIEKPSKYGEEIPIDVLTKCEFQYEVMTSNNKSDNNTTTSITKPVANPPEFVIIKISGNIKNRNSELWSVNDFTEKINQIIKKNVYITFRAGKTIYENCILNSFNPSIINIYNLGFDAQLKYLYEDNLYFQSANNGFRIITPQRQDLKNDLAEEVNLGIRGANTNLEQ